MIEYLISQREAVSMLMECGLLRTAAYNHLRRHGLGRMLVGHTVYSRVDVELLCAKVTENRRVTPVAAQPFDTDCGEAWCSLIDPDIDNVVFECAHESECKAAFASHRTVI